MKIKGKILFYFLLLSFISMTVIEDHTWRYLRVSSDKIIENFNIEELENDTAQGIRITIRKTTDFLECFIINNLDSIITIPRADGSIRYCATLIYKDSVWTELQRVNNSDKWCGNSFYFSELSPKNALTFRLSPTTNGTMKTKLKVKIIINGDYYYSNEIDVHLSQGQYEVAGNPIPGLYPNYDYYILMADQLFIDKLYDKAKEMYQIAHKIYSDENYANNRIKQCDKLIDK